MSDIAQGNQKVSKRFSAPDSDVIFQSSDNVLFHVHRRNLDTHTSGFPPPESETRGEVVQLTEDSSTLELLFQFMYPQPPPDLRDVPFVTIASLAEAAEKRVLPNHTDDILEYAVKHEHDELIQQMAPEILRKPLDELVNRMSPRIFIRWVLHYQKWAKLFHSVIAYYPGGLNSVCSHCGRHDSQNHYVIPKILSRLKDVSDLQNLDLIFTTEDLCCEHVKRVVRTWYLSMEAAVQAIPKFGDIKHTPLSRR